MFNMKTVMVLAFGVTIPFSARAMETRIELITVGRGESLFSRFGHAVLCVFSDTAPDGQCFNYGAARARPALAQDVVLGDANFLVKPEPYSYVVNYYTRHNRDLYAQQLPIDGDATTKIVTRLFTDSLPRNREYRYDPFRDNCSTRIRDVINEGTAGTLASATVGQPAERRYRSDLRAALAGESSRLMALDLVMGGDEELDAWQSMFSPEGLREQVQGVFGAEPVIVHRGSLSWRSPSWLAGRWPLFACAVSLLALCLLAGRKGGWTRVAALMFCGLVLTLPALLVDIFALSSRLLEAKHNLVLVLLLPSDALLLVAPPLCRTDRPRIAGFLRHYLTGRLVMIGVLGVLVAVQWARPSLLAWLALAAGAVGGARLTMSSQAWRVPSTVQAKLGTPHSWGAAGKRRRTKKRRKKRAR